MKDNLKLFLIVFSFISVNCLVAQEVQFKEEHVDSKLNLVFNNQKINFTISIDGKKLLSGKLGTQEE